jgi:prepilin-type N-terminal cleavage/methylation domain-containing protein
MQTNNNSQGFTLIEVLIAMAIIGALAAILFPVLSQAQTKSHTSQDLSNLRQIGTAIALYADSHSGALPSQPDAICYKNLAAGGSCAGFDSVDVASATPIQHSLQSFGAPPNLFISNNDKTQEVWRKVQNSKLTWHEETSTSLFSGSSFSYQCSLEGVTRLFDGTDQMPRFSMLIAYFDDPFRKDYRVSITNDLSASVKSLDYWNDHHCGDQ